MDKSKYFLGIDVLTATRERIAWTFDNFEKISISFSGGKDSTCMTHLVCEEARKRGRKVALLFIDWEIQYQLTIDHVQRVFDEYADCIEPYWVALPLLSDNSCSQYEPEWISWDKAKKDLWTRQPPKIAITDEKFFPFWYYSITFEEFVPKFGEWYGHGEPTAIFVGIRTRESLNRYRALANRRKSKFDDKIYTTCVSDNAWNIYPIYDWKAEDDWTYLAKFHKSYNRLYDRFYQAGLTIHQMRVDEPFGTTTRRSLWLYQVIEPQTWGKVVLRTAGANSSALYCKEMGNILGNGRVTLPDGHNWQSFAMYLLDTMPKHTAEHFKNKISVYLKWYMEKKGYPDGIPDEADYHLETKKDVPSWRRIVKCLLKNDYWCKSLGFSPTKQSAYSEYTKRMKANRAKWEQENKIIESLNKGGVMID